MTSTAMELLPLLCLCLLTRSGSVFADNPDSPVNIVIVKEQNDAILPCSLGRNENIKQELFDWKKDESKEVFLYDSGPRYENDNSDQDKQFRGRVFHFKEQLEFGNASIIIKKTIVADSGNYTCLFPRLKPSRQFRISLVVEPILTIRPDVPGASPKPSLTTIEHGEHWALLQCEVQGASPRPSVVWKDNSGKILSTVNENVTENAGKYDVILQVNVTKTDFYHCVATQGEIKHQIFTKSHVYIAG